MTFAAASFQLTEALLSSVNLVHKNVTKIGTAWNSAKTLLARANLCIDTFSPHGSLQSLFLARADLRKNAFSLNRPLAVHC